jgi:hypothetical protein
MIVLNAAKIAVLLGLLAAGGVKATSNAVGPRASQVADLKAPIWQGSQITYLDLFRKLLPDLKNPTGESEVIAHRSIPLRRLDADSDTSALESDISISAFESRQIKSDGKSIILLRADLAAADANESTPYEGEASLLAAFSAEPKLELIDALDIKTDRFTGFWGENPIMHLNPQNDALIVYSTHWNAGESYNDISLLFIQRGRFKLIANQFIFNTQGCGVTFTETPSFQAVPAVGRKYPNILLKVKLKKDPDDRNCERRTAGFVRYYQAIYSWNEAKAKYETASSQLDRLDKFNRGRL